MLHYIPEHLHINGRPNIPVFELDESLYRRVPEAYANDPFGSISLVDLSVNRSGPPAQPFCKADDVLFNYNISEKHPDTRIDGEVVINLVIRELTTNGTYCKTEGYPQEKPTDFCNIELVHREEPCNYTHCAFVVKFNGVEMNFTNYNKALKKHSYLKIWCKLELEKMILKSEVRLSWPVPSLGGSQEMAA